MSSRSVSHTPHIFRKNYQNELCVGFKAIKIHCYNSIAKFHMMIFFVKRTTNMANILGYLKEIDKNYFTVRKVTFKQLMMNLFFDIKLNSYNIQIIILTHRWKITNGFFLEFFETFRGLCNFHLVGRLITQMNFKQNHPSPSCLQ